MIELFNYLIELVVAHLNGKMRMSPRNRKLIKINSYFLRIDKKIFKFITRTRDVIFNTLSYT